MEIDAGQSPHGRIGAWTRAVLATCALCAATAAAAAHIGVQVDGVDGPLKAAVIAGLEAAQYGPREVTTAQAHRLYEHAEAQARAALEPYGYYDVQARGELRETNGNWLIALQVTPGEPVKVNALDIAIDGDADGQRPVQKALAAFAPAKGQPLDHAAYEKSKATLQAAIVASGYLDAKLVTHRIEVTRSAKTADIHLAWIVGRRYRIGTTTFAGGQFADELMQRYIPWREGDFYTQAKLLAFQQRLIDADYFSIAQVQPDIEHAHDGIVPIKVLLAPAKRTIYTGGVFIGTDTGPGVRGGIERRWINLLGHKVKVEAVVATQL
jgi:translocation and assembly module TamA